MKLLIIYHAGAMQNARAIYQALARSSNVDLTVIVPTKLKVDRVYDSSGWLNIECEEECDGYHIVPVPLYNPSNYGQGFESECLRRLIKQLQPDIIHVLDEPTSGYLFQVVWQRLIVAPHSKVLFYGFQNLPIHLRRRSRLKWKLTWAQMAGGAAANSEALENVKHAGFPRHRPLERIFWGIPTDIFKPMDSVALKKDLNLDYEHIVGFVGSFVPVKGLPILLAAMCRLPSTAHCLMIGSGPMRAELELWSGLPDLSGRIHLCDVMPPGTVAKYMNCMDVLVLPSVTMPYLKEQYGRVLAEAMACGVPVVGSDSGAIPEVIGSAGSVVPEGDASALAEAVHTAILDSEARQCLKQQGLQRAEQELSVEAMAQRLLDFYHRVLGA